MADDLTYKVRSVQIGDLIGSLRTGKLMLSPYFQRNLVWRDSHKHDFIETILQGLPIPQIFLAKGEVDFSSMQANACVVDGQQRLNAIREFAADTWPVNGSTYSQLDRDQKASFIKYEVPVIDFDLDAGDPRLKDVFKRLNRTFYSLSIIERISTEYSSSSFLLAARVLCGDIVTSESEDEEIDAAEVLDGGLGELGSIKDESKNEYLRDPGITDEMWAWMQENAGGIFSRLLSDQAIFSSYEFQRKIPIMFALNVLSTIEGGYYGRNDKVKNYLEQYAFEYPQSNAVLYKLNCIAEMVKKFGLGSKSIWFNKANFFTVVCELARDERLLDIDIESTSDAMKAFENDPPRDFQAAAREAVNNRPERQLRANAFRNLVVYS